MPDKQKKKEPSVSTSMMYFSLLRTIKANTYAETDNVESHECLLELKEKEKKSNNLAAEKEKEREKKAERMSHRQLAILNVHGN